MKNINKLIYEIKESIDNDIEFIKKNIMTLEEIEELKVYMNFTKIKSILTDYEKLIGKINELNFDSDYNDNFINYIKEEKNNLKDQFIGYKNENFKKNISKIKNNEVNYENIEMKYESVGYGGGRPPINSDEEILFSILYIENNMLYYLESLDDFINNLHILKDFSEIDTNVVIIGANGSGKSTLSRRLKVDNLNQRINIISSHHILYLTSDDFIIPRDANEVLDIDTYQKEKKLVTEEEPFDNESFINSLHNLTNYLLNLHHRQKGDTLNRNEKETLLEKVLKTCNKLLKKKMVIINGIIACSDENLDTYDFNQMSDGERQVFYFVASVLVNEQDGYIIVDEPENHLNSQVCKLLWDTLEFIKKDSTFVYITHDPKFAVSRINSKIIWSKSFTYPNIWDYETLEEGAIPEELLIEVLGSKENIIFCEGESDSIDKQVYEAIFFDDKVIAVGGHLNVINYTKAINNISNLNIKAKGLIDKDGKTEKEIKKYEKYNIYVLPFNEIEMLLLSKEVLEKMNEAISILNKKINIDEWQNEILQICDDRKEKIILGIVKSRAENLLSSQKLQNCKELGELKDNFKLIFDSIDLEVIYEEEKQRLETAISNNEYEEILKMCNLKNEVLMGVPNREGYKNYHNEAVALIQNDNELKEILKDKYFF
ncbi:AAA family ATPase [Macrococcoides caseolyticum]|uniref:AAA family ATPase n=1 Tax=Macrococcoides caseolyticum TaxID=69966 RepID=UPI001E4D8655|nr:AAA family ATPase [Macrococcus caseolyticus]